MRRQLEEEVQTRQKSRPQNFSDIYVQLVIANLFSPHIFALHDNHLKKLCRLCFLFF